MPKRFYEEIVPAEAFDHNNILGPDQILPCQYVTERQVDGQTAAYLDLVRSVLELALTDLHASPGNMAGGSTMEWRIQKAKGLQWAARLWFEDESTHAFSFIWCCDALGLEPIRLRMKLLGDANGAQITS